MIGLRNQKLKPIMKIFDAYAPLPALRKKTKTAQIENKGAWLIVSCFQSEFHQNTREILTASDLISAKLRSCVVYFNFQDDNSKTKHRGRPQW